MEKSVPPLITILNAPPPLPPTLLDIPFIWFENVLVYKFQVTPPPPFRKKISNIIKCV